MTTFPFLHLRGHLTYTIDITKNYQTDSKNCTFNNFYDTISLLFVIFYIQLDNIHMVKYTIDDIIEYVERNNITKTKDLPSNYLNYIYRYKLSDRLPFIQEKKQKSKQRIDSNRLQPWYDIERLLPYLTRWAWEEGTTVEQQAREGCLMPEWLDWVQRHPEYKDK